MIVLLAGDTHTGKTLLAQELLERLGYPYLSVDHLKMGLIRAGYTSLTPSDDSAALTAYLWPVLRETIKTAIENGQNLTVEGCYIPPDYADSFTSEYLSEIKYICLALTERYLTEHLAEITSNESAIERRSFLGDFSVEEMKAANSRNIEMCHERGLKCIVIDDYYDAERIVHEAVEYLKASQPRPA